MRLSSVTVVRAALAALVAGALLAGCAGEDAGDAEPTTPSPSSPAAPSPSPPPPVLPTQPPTSVPPVPPVSPPATGRPGEMTITGELVAGVEAGCLLLETTTGQYLLFGEPVEQLRTGTTVSLRGQVRTDMMSTCQQGTPFEVTEVIR